MYEDLTISQERLFISVIQLHGFYSFAQVSNLFISRTERKHEPVYKHTHGLTTLLVGHNTGLNSELIS